MTIEMGALLVVSSYLYKNKCSIILTAWFAFVLFRHLNKLILTLLSCISMCVCVRLLIEMTSSKSAGKTKSIPILFVSVN